MQRARSSRWLLIAAVLMATNAALGSVMSYDLCLEYIGNPPPGGDIPWLNVTFDDGNSPGSVDMTFTATNLINDEYVSQLYLNLDPDLDPTDLAFSSPIKTGSFDLLGISLSVDTYKADGDGKFDILLNFATYDGALARFGVDDALQYTIDGISSLTAGSFDFYSYHAGGQGEHIITSHVQSIDGGLSAWITVPEPSLMTLLALGGAVLMRRKRD